MPENTPNATAVTEEKPHLATPIKFSTKALDVPINQFYRDDKGKLDISWNIREQTSDRYDLDTLASDIAYRGLITKPLVLYNSHDKKYRPLQGYRRIGAVEKLGWKTVPSLVVTDIDKADAIALMADHSQTKRLNRVELYYTVERLLENDYTEKEIVKMTLPLLQEWFPLGDDELKTILSSSDPAQGFLNRYRGTIQTMRRAFESPTVLRDEYVRTLRREQGAWLNTAELKTGHKLYMDAKAAANDPTINRQNPPKDFTKWFNRTRKEKVAKKSGVKPKSGAMKTRQAIVDLEKKCDSLAIKYTLFLVLNRVSDESVKHVNAIFMEMEKHLSATQLNVIKEVCKEANDDDDDDDENGKEKEKK